MSGDKNILVSVLIPIYNSAKWLSRCLDSVVNQTYKKIEILLYDDGSIDNSAELYSKYIEIDQRIQLIGNERVGIAKARDCLAQSANGYASIFIDSDDWIESQMIEVMVEHILSDNLDYCGCSMFFDKYDGKKTLLTASKNYYSIFNKKDIISQYINLTTLHGSLCNKLIRTDILKKYKFKYGWDFAEDASFVWNAINDIHKAGLTSVPLYHYCYHADSLSEWRFKDTHLNFVELWKGIVQDINAKHPELLSRSRASLAFIVMSTMHSMMVSNHKDNQKVDYLMKILSQHRLQYLKHPKGGIRYIMFFCALSVSWALAYACVRILKSIQN